jgi:hypothetical protein
LYEDSEAFAGILILVRGAGVIEYSELKYSKCYSHGRILHVRPLWDVPVIALFLKELEQRQLHSRQMRIGDIKAEDRQKEQAAAWSMITSRSQVRTLLNSRQDLGHGGMIAICDGNPVGIEQRFPMCTSDWGWLHNNNASG